MGNVVDGMAAANTLLSYTNINPGYCLHYVWTAYAAHGAWSNETYPTAYSAWLGSSGQHPGDRNPPEGVPVYWGPRSNSSAGDVVISIGNGRVAATDWPYNGRTGTCTIDEREKQIGRPYLGWTDNMLGNPILQVQPKPEPPKKRKGTKMIHAAWREDNGTISIQHAPRGRIMQLGSQNEWNGIAAATGAELAPIASDEMRKLDALYGRIPYAATDMEHATGLVIVIESGGAGTTYLFGGGKFVPITDENTIPNLEGRVPQLLIPTADLQALITATS
jgi:hypothetical protein